MAPGAIEIAVASLEGKISQPVIKHILIQADDIEIPPLMISMAMLAFGFPGVRAAAVKAGLPADIRGHLFMAGQA